MRAGSREVHYRKIGRSSEAGVSLIGSLGGGAEVLVFAFIILASNQACLFAQQQPVRPSPFRVNIDALQKPWSVKGRLLSSSGKPVPTVSVRIVGSKASTSTDANGQFVLSIPASEVLPTSRKPQFKELVVAIPGNHASTWRFVIPNISSQLESKEVTDYRLPEGVEFLVRAKFKDGSPAPNICFYPAKDQAGNRGFPSITNEAGETFLLMKPGTCGFYLGSDKPGYLLPRATQAAEYATGRTNVTPMLSLDFVKGVEKTLELVLDRAPIFRIEVVMADGTPVADASVALMDNREPESSIYIQRSPEAKTDGLGQVSIQAISCPSDYAYITCWVNVPNGQIRNQVLVRDCRGGTCKLILDAMNNLSNQ